ncbi:MAG TPA: ATP-dependent DNA helicase RecG [Verrucomicrobiae bacterium]|jgi:ATP-dependent DNA helicase RecG|nr:ATP-dependent DNA helicase RecG [Verrucomicrobiae bacterium]
MTVTPANEKTSPLTQPVTALWGVGMERAKLLARLNIFTIEDLLLHKPRRYEDRRKFLAIRDLKVKETATVRGKIVVAGTKRWKKGTRAMFECVFDDGTALLHCRWWQGQPWMEDYFAVGREFVVFGKVDSLRPRTMDHPESELVEPDDDEFIHVNRIAPIHPLTEGLTARVMRTLVWRALEKFEDEIAEPHPAERVSPGAPGETTTERRARSDAPYPLPSRANAVRMIQFPAEFSDVEIARRRLALDEFVTLQLQIRERRKKFETNARALPCGGDNQLIKPFLAALGFKLTEAQTRVLREIRADMRGAHPMRRLLQGDVGSGKTAVAACTALMAIESGFNVALMAPTEILAEQHFRNFEKWLHPLGVKVELQTGTRKTVESRGSRVEDQHHPASTLFIGTHALLTGGFEIPRLGLVVIDEQHKFGVTQREQLVRKGRYPHLLVMTATPIPRTLGLTLYGELDVSSIDELPPGRGRVKTLVRAAEKLPKVWTFLREKLAAGRQAYVVYPRVEDTGETGIKAVTKEFANLAKLLAPFRVGLLHGRLNGSEKEQVMAGFRSGKTQVLLATSLIEVGVDVPNATVMLVENAEMFGLAQLHQLRGRIGRGAHESFCILISDAPDPASRARLKVLEETADGFKIAEADLKLRGPGELLGKDQSGMPNFRFGNLVEDLDLIRQARQIAATMG